MTSSDRRQCARLSNRWYPAAIETAHVWRIAGHDVRIVTPALFIATKLEAFRGRRRGDFFTSHDLEDIVTVVDGRPAIVAEVGGADSEVLAYIASDVRTLLDNQDFVEALTKLRVRFSIINLTNKEALCNFLSTFSGNRFELGE